jgi:hypothetical protein
MPRFYAEDMDIDVDEFLESCSSSEIDEVIDYLIDMGHIKPSQREDYEVLSLPEREFEDTLNKLHGKYRSLTKAEEEIIAAIAKRF